MKSTPRPAGTLALRLILALVGLLLAAPATEALPQRRRGRTSPPAATRPSDTKPVALVVLMENGGIEANLEACLGKSNRSRKIVVATSGSISIPLPSEKGLPVALKNAAHALAQLSAPVAPSQWKVETITLDEWVRRTSDLLLEELVKALQAKSGIRSLYSKVTILEDEKLTPARAVATICGLGKTHRVDVHTLVHGRNNEFIGHDGQAFGRTNFFDPIRAAGVDIRAVYQMNCVSGTLIDEWLELGADVVNGTLGTKNNYMPQQYFHFQEHWTRGRSFGNAVTQAYADARDYSEPAYETAGLVQYIEDSRMRVEGATGLTAKPTLLQVALPIANAAAQTAAKTVQIRRQRGRCWRG